MYMEILLALLLCILIAGTAYGVIYLRERYALWPTYRVNLYVPYDSSSVSSMVQKYHALKDDFATYWKQCLNDNDIKKVRYCRKATAPQKKYLYTMGFFDTTSISEGQAIDLLALEDEPLAEDLDILNFFHIDASHMNSTIAAWKAIQLLSIENNQRAYYFQPVTPLQKEEFKFFRYVLPKGITTQEAECLLDKYRIQTQITEPVYWTQWCGYKYILDAFVTQEQGELYNLDVPSISQIRHAVDQLAQQGYTVEMLMNLEYTALEISRLYPKLIRG